MSHFRHETSALRAGRGIIAAWVIRILDALYILGAYAASDWQFFMHLLLKVGRNRMLLLLLAYAAMLALIGMKDSEQVVHQFERETNCKFYRRYV